jgi:hypothetical protein
MLRKLVNAHNKRNKNLDVHHNCKHTECVAARAVIFEDIKLPEGVFIGSGGSVSYAVGYKLASYQNAETLRKCRPWHVASNSNASMYLYHI